MLLKALLLSLSYTIINKLITLLVVGIRLIGNTI